MFLIESSLTDFTSSTWIVVGSGIVLPFQKSYIVLSSRTGPGVNPDKPFHNSQRFIMVGLPTTLI